MYEKTRYTMQILSPHHEKHTKLEKILTIEKMIPQGDPLAVGRRKNFFVEILQTNYIFGVHRHEKLKSRENFNYRKNDTPKRGPLNPKMLISQL